MDTTKKESKEQRIDKIFNIILELASGNLEVRGEPTGVDDELDAVIVGLNMLGEELLARCEEWKKSQESLRESEKKFREIFEGVRDVILTLDMTGKIVDINNRVEEIYGWKREEVVGKRFWETPFFLPGNVRLFVGVFLDFLKTGKIVKMMELTVRDKNDKIRHIEGSAFLLKKDGKPWRLLSIVRDITDRKESEKEKQNLEMQLMQAQKMKAIGQLSAGIAHELNNALTPVLGNAELIEIEMEKNFYSSKIAEYCNAILQSSLRAKDITQKLLGFTRQGKFNPKDIDINSVVSSATKLLAQGLSSTTKYEVKCNLPAEKFINAHATQVHQIINNLTLNARDSMPGGGTITVATEDVIIDDPIVGRFSTIPPGKYVKLSVKDEGTGISEEIMSKIFDPFFTTKQRDRGSGLGLAVVWGIVKNHGAFIDLKTEKCRGTVFKVYFPAVDRREETVRATKKPVISVGKGRILIVDDEEYIRKVAERFLNLQGYETLTASNGMEGFKAYREGDFDLVLADLIMSPVNGVQMYHKIKKIDPEAKIFIMSGFQDDEQIASLLEHGALGFISKPFDLYKLGEMINSALAG